MTFEAGVYGTKSGKDASVGIGLGNGFANVAGPFGGPADARSNPNGCVVVVCVCTCPVVREKYKP